MKIVIIGGTGLIGSKLVKLLRKEGHEAVAASPSTGIDSVTGKGLVEALQGASAVVDVTNSPSWEDAAVLTFFETSTRNLLSHGAAAGVKHHVALSVVGTERLQESGFFRAKLAQEKLIEGGSAPYTIVRATQFFEFVKSIVDSCLVGDELRAPAALIQPIAGDDVASAMARIAVGAPANGMVELAGPEAFRMDELLRRSLAARNERRQVVVDANAQYFGVRVSERSLVPEDGAERGQRRFEEWVRLG